MDALQQSTISMLKNKMLDGNARGESQCLKPELNPSGQEGNRRSERINKSPKHCYQFAAQTKALSLNMEINSGNSKVN